MGKTIWIINQYGSTPETGMGGRHFYFARELSKQGNLVYLIIGSYSHILRKPPKVDNKFKLEVIDGVNILWVRVPRYKSAHGKRRVLNWFYFAWKLLKLPKIIRNKPDSIICSSPSIISFLPAAWLSKKFRARLVFDVRDIWPLTLIELGGYSPRHPFISFMQRIEDYAYRTSDAVISNWPYADRHIKNRGYHNVPFSWIPNGFTMDEFSGKEKLPNHIVSKLPTNKFIVGYAGTIGTANAVDVLMKCAESLKNKSDIAFVIVGDGKDRANLEISAINKNLNNVHFIGPVNKKYIQSMLNHFDVCYVGFRKSPLYRFGNSLNKLPEYFMSSKPIIYSITSTFLPVEEAKAGITVPAENPKAIAEAIIKLYNLDQSERDKLGENGRCYAIKNNEYAYLTEKLSDILF